MRQLTDEQIREQLGFWERELAGAPVVLGLPVDGVRSGVSAGGGRVGLELGGGLVEGVVGLARARGVSVFCVLLAGWQVLMARYAGQDDVLTGVPVAGRDHGQVGGLVGFFVNTLVVRTRVGDGVCFGDVVDRTGVALRGALANQDVPFELLVRRLVSERDVSRNPLVQTVVTAGSGRSVGLSLPGVVGRGVSSRAPGAQFDLALDVPGVSGLDGVGGEVSGGLELVLTFDSELFRRETAERLLSHYVGLLGRMVECPGVAVSGLGLLSRGEVEEQLGGWSVGGDSNPVISSHRLVHEVGPGHPALVVPDGPAIVSSGVSYTHREVFERTNQLARYLTDHHNIRPGSLVAILMSPGAGIPTAFLGVMKSGAAFVPLSKDWPTARIEIILWDTAASVIVTDEYQPALTHLGIPQVVLDDIPRDAPSDIEGIAQPSLEDPVYVMYTSGSTGKPKGALIAHRGISNRIEWMNQALGTDPDRVILQTHQHVFNPSVWQLLWPLAYGGTTVVPDYYDPLDIRRTIDMIEEHGVTLINFVPFVFAMFVEHLEKDPSALERLRTLRTVIVGGDVMRTSTARAFKRVLPDVELVNFYGQTETTIACVAYRVGADVPDPVPVGRPISNVRLVILDPHLNLVPLGHTGEICIAGDSLGIGYVNNEAATERAFRYVDLGPGWHNTRIYRTGDVGRLRPDGNLECLGRLDHQVKLHGYRIELGEIENALRECENVHDAGATIQESPELGKRLISYVVPESGRQVDVSVVRNTLYARLPDYMVPAVIGILDRLPLTPSGKLDRKALPEANAHEAVETKYVAPRNRTEKLVSAIWAEELGLERVGVNDNYFALGGQSMLAVKIVLAIREAVQQHVPIRWMFRYPTVAELARAVSEQAPEDETAEPIVRARRAAYRPDQ